MPNGSIPLDRITKVLTPSGPQSKLLSNATWSLLLLWLLVTIVCFCCCCFTDLWLLPFLKPLVKFVSFKLQQFHMKIMVLQRIQPLLRTDPAEITTEVIVG